MKLIDEIIKYAADKKNRKIMTAAENDLRANIAFMLSRHNDNNNHIGWAASDYKWEYSLLQDLINTDIQYLFERCCNRFNLTKDQISRLEQVRDEFVAWIKCRQVRLCCEMTAKYPGNDITKI